MVEEEGKFVPEEEVEEEEFKVDDLIEACGELFFDKEKDEEVEVGGYSREEFAEFMREEFPQDNPDSFNDALGFLYGFLVEAGQDPDAFLTEAGIQELAEEEGEPENPK